MTWVMERHLKCGRRVMARLEQLGVGDLARTIASRRGVRVLEMVSDSREKGLAPARRELWTVIYDSVPDMSFPHLARLVERDHTTILLGIEMRRAELEAMVGGHAAPSWKEVKSAREARRAAKGRAA